jgi:hypothetical protein
MPISCDRKRRSRAPQRTSAGMVRVVVKLRPEQYDELFHHVRLIGSTLSEFLRETAASAMAPPEQ